MYPNQTEVAELMRQRTGAGVEAELAQLAVDSLPEVQSEALMAFYTSPLPFDRQAVELIGIDPDVYRRRLRAAHVDLVLAFSLVRRQAAAARRRREQDPQPG